MRMIGHNSAAYGEQIQAAPPVCTVLDDDYKKLFYYAKWHIGDYITGTQGMTPELEGIYMRFLMRLYDRGKPFPDDDRFMVMVMGLSTVRVWKRFKDSLVAIGKITCRNGCLTNGRFEKERMTRASELKKQADSARKRWANEREKKKVSPKLQPNLDETSPKLSANVGEKANENNEIPVTPHMPPRDERLEKKEEGKKEKGRPASTEQVAAGGLAGQNSGTNAATEMIMAKVAKWINPHQPDYRTAREWLASTLTMFGEPSVRAAFAEMETKMASGDVVPRPLKLFTAICQGKQTSSAPGKARERMAPWEEKELRVYNEGTQAMERLKARYALEEEQGNG